MQFLADVILESAGVPLQQNMLRERCVASANKEWNVKDAANTLLLAPILIATVTFTAGFTEPGGFYTSDDPASKKRGMVILADQTFFKIFLAFNTFAMYSSTLGSIILLWVPLGDRHFAERVYGVAKFFVYVALITMPVAFLAAIRLVVSNDTLLSEVISAIGFIFIFFIIFARILGRFPLGTRLPLFHQLGYLFIWIILLLFYGWNDILIDQDGEVNLKYRDDKTNKANYIGSISEDDQISEDIPVSRFHHRLIRRPSNFSSSHEL